MPVNLALKNLARDGRFSADDARTLKRLVQEGKVSGDEAKQALTRYGDVMDPEAQRELAGFTGGRARGGLSQLASNLVGSGTVARGARNDNVEGLQRALMAVGQKTQNAGMILASGADGIFGGETESAVRAFQAQNGLAVTGKADASTLQALDATLRGDPLRSPTPLPPGPSGTQQPRPRRGLQGANAAEGATAQARPTPANVVDAAQKLVDGPTAESYGVPNAWVNSDPRHALPAGKELKGTKDKWKCNLFAGNVIANAGFEPPYYGNRTKGGEYPNANQLYKWSDKYAAQYGNKSRFDLGDEVRDLPAMGTGQRAQRLREMFDRLKPGDLVIADHLGTDVADGGHCRVFLGKNDDGTYRFAQAARERAEVQNETIDDLMGEEHVWILRPNTPRT